MALCQIIVADRESLMLISSHGLLSMYCFTAFLFSTFEPGKFLFGGASLIYISSGLSGWIPREDLPSSQPSKWR